MRNLRAEFLAFTLLSNTLMGGCESSTALPERGFEPDELVASGISVQSDNRPYLIGPLDKINVRVFGQPDLSVEKIQVDGGGQIVLPLIGTVQAEGKTARDLSTEIADKLKQRYLINPSVSVFIDDAVSQRVTVTGAVMESGIYPVKGQMTLLQAISMAKGPDNKVADLHRVAVFRLINGKRARAVFDVRAIRSGQAEDPAIYGGDTVIVADSKARRTWRELVGVLPGLGVFSYF